MLRGTQQVLFNRQGATHQVKSLDWLSSNSVGMKGATAASEGDTHALH